MTVSLRAMRYFNTALKHQSISSAAEELSVAASAVSSAIDGIEAQFQLKLVNRFRSKGIAATASGKVLERKFAHLLEEYEAILSEGSELKSALLGELRVGYYAPVAPAFLPDILSAHEWSSDQTRFHFEECDNERAQSGLLAGDFDAILFVSNAAHPLIEFDILVDAPAYCLAAAEHPFSRKTEVTLKDIAKEPVILLNRPAIVDYYRQIFDAAGQKPAILAYANSVEMVRSLVSSGHGCAVLNMLPSTDKSYSGRSLAAVPIKGKLPSLTLSLGYDKTNPRRLVTHFASACRAYFETAGADRHTVTPTPV